MPNAWNIDFPRVRSPGKVPSGVIPTDTVKGVDHDLEDVKNSAVISASLVMIGPFPPIPAIVETNEELY